jgi:serine/threonine protein kinase
MGLCHRDIKSQNTLYSLVKPGGYFKYVIAGVEYYVENVGVIFYLADFGVSKSYSPVYSSNKNYGSRMVEVISNNDNDVELSPITCKYDLVFSKDKYLIKPATIVEWQKGNFEVITGTKSNTFGPVDIAADRIVNLTNFMKFPVTFFFEDIQDVIRMIVGGEQTWQNNEHQALKTPINEKLSRLGYKQVINNTIGTVRYLIASRMIYEIYFSEPVPTVDYVIDTFIS